MTGSRKLYAMPPIYRRWERHLISVGLVAYWVRFGLGLVAFPFVYTWWRMKRDPYRRESLSLATILAYFPNFPNFSILSYRCIILIWSFFFFYIYILLIIFSLILLFSFFLRVIGSTYSSIKLITSFYEYCTSVTQCVCRTITNDYQKYRCSFYMWSE